MIETWKFSKGILLTILFTAAVSFLVLDYAYSQHRSSEILTGVIAGLTIILGMITAEWLRSAREQVELTRIRFFELVSYLERFLYNFDDFMQDPFSHDQSRHLEDFFHVNSSATLLARTTRWPQPNAKKIREGGHVLIVKVEAMQQDADENGIIWDLEDRMRIVFDAAKLGPLIWAGTPEKSKAYRANLDSYRKSPRNEGMPAAWTRKRSK